jgi:uncharacterized Ntn-hydrolase superfamily protein
MTAPSFGPGSGRADRTVEVACPPMTFSIVGRSADGRSLGVAVASKFLAVGAYVPAARADAGAVATQATGNLAFRSEGLTLMARGLSAEDVIARFFEEDPKADERQAGAVDARGGAATFTGSRVQHWHGGLAGECDDGSYAIQGNMLAGPQVVEAMRERWLADRDQLSLARRLLDSLDAGQAAGGDPRGKQSAAVLVVSPGGGYGGTSDVVVDLRCDDAPEPIAELRRMLDLHDLYFGTTPEDELLELAPLEAELRERLGRTGYRSGDLERDLYDWMGRENFEERWHDGALDPVVLDQLRAMTD